MRIEKDLLGEKSIPKDAYYGIQTMRAIENFPITGYKPDYDLIVAFIMIKKACALANIKTGLLDEKIGNAIIKAADEVLGGKFLDQFVVDVIQGGAGTSMNMNVNEVLANRAIELLDDKKGNYQIVSPNTHVNMSQSTNDTYPVAMRIAIINKNIRLINELKSLEISFLKKAHEFDDVVKMGRSHLQDAVPIRLDQEFEAYTDAIKRSTERIIREEKGIHIINLGATAVGTGLNTTLDYIELATENLREITGIPLERAKHLVDATQNLDALASFSSSLKNLALTLSKICNDLRLMSSGPRCGLNEINLPPMQPGSSIMPGKVNPVIPEVVNQVCFQVIGNDTTVALAIEAGQFELNVMEPVMCFNLLQSIEILSNAVKVLRERCIEGIKANKERCKEMVENSIGIVTALLPYIGYEKATEIAKETLASGRSVPEIVEEKGLLSKEKIEHILSPRVMTEPGIFTEFIKNSVLKKK
ncbi:aspartate ammonia-lyase [Desulfonispora thiosulfatigenes DSM 11270]|uniref:Aspartate ammonia-lyase n=1 Tax=Desulfonispora thiosulfatigenes DSM 11270 TaxID=656914 RepID=A0A1W1VSP8_DESTI|nr:aspartate ammonia-lyase [Desulfonispora thiosulfatigenes]SMB96369.1 aspartate ammonia-lyase [Desulfonispora thiosulfatigenes DSM 11270]